MSIPNSRVECIVALVIVLASCVISAGEQSEFNSDTSLKQSYSELGCESSPWISTVNEADFSSEAWRAREFFYQEHLRRKSREGWIWLAIYAALALLIGLLALGAHQLLRSILQRSRTK